jgi:hypothetical protein
MTLMMSRIEVSRPPGVSICSTISSAPSCSARSMPRWMKSAVAGPIGPVTGITSTTGAATADAAQSHASSAAAVIHFPGLVRCIAAPLIRACVARHILEAIIGASVGWKDEGSGGVCAPSSRVVAETRVTGPPWPYPMLDDL